MPYYDTADKYQGNMTLGCFDKKYLLIFKIQGLFNYMTTIIICFKLRNNYQQIKCLFDTGYAKQWRTYVLKPIIRPDYTQNMDFYALKCQNMLPMLFQS